MFMPPGVPDNQEDPATPLKKILLFNGASSWGGKTTQWQKILICFHGKIKTSAKFKKKRENSLLANTARSLTPCWRTLRGVWLIAGEHCAESDSLLANTARSLTPCWQTLRGVWLLAGEHCAESELSWQIQRGVTGYKRSEEEWEFNEKSPKSRHTINWIHFCEKISFS